MHKTKPSKTIVVDDASGYEADHESERLEKFHDAFRKRLGDVAGKRISRKVSLINRRLDALARLLERDQICVAVRYDPIAQKIIVSSNKIYETSRETNKSIKNIQKLMGLLAKHEATMEEIIDELSKIIAENLYQEFRYSLGGKTLLEIQEDVKVQLESLFRSGEKTKVWEELAGGGGVGFDAELIRRTSRLARDFIKLRASILGLAHAAGETKQILETIRDGKFLLCKNGDDKRHAEMRQVDDLDAQAEQKPYLGISKLCCARCSLTIEVLHIPTRGQHGQIFNGWDLPTLFKREPGFLRQYLGTAAPPYEALSEVGREKALALIRDGKQVTPAKVAKQNMMPDTSSSDEVFGLSDASGEIDTLDVADVLHANAAKAFDREGYQNLRETNLSPHAISTIFRASPTTFEALSADQIKKLLGSENDIHMADLMGLYEEDFELFNLVVEDRGDLIAREGFEGAVERYRNALGKQRKAAESSENDTEEYEEYDAAAEAEADYFSENGWSYDECSDDSQNRYRYRSDGCSPRFLSNLLKVL